MALIGKPREGEFPQFYAGYIAKAGDDAFSALAEQAGSTPQRLQEITEAQAMHRYAPGKWSVKEVIVHMADAERVFAYRALRFARADATELPGFDENAWVPASIADRRAASELLFEFAAVRAATLALFAGLDEEALLRSGIANGNPISVRALAYVIAGHERHHMGLLRERYGVG